MEKVRERRGGEGVEKEVSVGKEGRGGGRVRGECG